MKELIATIHFIGLCMFTSAAATDNKTLHVVLPRIQSTRFEAQQINMQASRVPSGYSAQFPRNPGLGGVEDHTAFLAFRDGDLLNVSGWVPQPMPATPGYQYIVLSGEALSVHTYGSNNPASAKPTGLPSAKCCEKQELLPGFKSVDGSAAAAIFRLPQGKVQTCSSVPMVGGSTVYNADARLDTKVDLKNRGALLVTGDLKGKPRVLVLAGDATLYVGNLPSAWVASPTYKVSHSPVHYRAYAAMFKHTTVTSCDYKPHASAAGINRCGEATPSFRFGDSNSSGKTAAVSAECSNSTWP